MIRRLRYVWSCLFGRTLQCGCGYIHYIPRKIKFFTCAFCGRSYRRVKKTIAVRSGCAIYKEYCK